jgi:hypothetical protein
MKISLIYRYADLKQRFLDAQDDDDLDDSLNQPKYLEIYAEAVKRWEQEKARGKK